MNKKLLVLSITAILIAISSFVFIKSNKLQFNLDSTKIQSLEYDFSDYGIEHKEITNKEDIDKVIKYLNSLSLPITLDRPKDAVNIFRFKDNNGNITKLFSFGDSGVLWVDKKTYVFGSSNIETFKNLLNDIDKQK